MAPKTRGRLRDSPKSHCLESLKNAKLHTHNFYIGDLGQTHLDFLVVGLFSVDFL